MPKVLIPKYSQSQIDTNFFNRNNNENISQFIADNYIQYNQNLSKNNQPIPVNTPISNSLLNSIQADYGNGPISNGINSLVLINTNVISGTQNSYDIFGNYILYGYDINFKYVTTEIGSEIILKNLQMFDILNIASQDLQVSYNVLIQNIIIDLKAGTFNKDNYTSALLIQSRNIAKQVKSSIGNGVI